MEHAPRPAFMAPEKAAEVIRARVVSRAPLTVADVAAQTGLALRDAESGLTWLSKEYRGQLRVTAEGSLVHLFPTGFSKPWEAADSRRRAAKAVGRGLMGALRFIVRAWVAVVLVGYAAVFVGLILALTFARQGNDDRRSNDIPGGALAYGLLRVVSDAFFWTFHPWSPFSVYSSSAYGGYDAWGMPRARQQARGPKVPLYERVNRFFFGPQPAPEDARADERRVVEAIRAGKGRIGLADVMRVTGLPREQADPMMARLMLDFDGDVGVSEDGGIVYRFPEIRRTAAAPEIPFQEPPPAAWDRSPKPLAPLTGNPAGTNMVIGGLNAFNLLMGLWSIENGMTLERTAHLFDRIPHPIADTGLPIALGLVPLVFSALLFLLPASRALLQPLKRRKFLEEKGRLAVLKHVLERLRAKAPVTDGSVAHVWRAATGQTPDPKRIDHALVALGGDVAIAESGQTRWRFADLETEAAAVEAEREAASAEEARLGAVVFATDKN